MFSITIEDKVLLAERVMGWTPFPERDLEPEVSKPYFIAYLNLGVSYGQWDGLDMRWVGHWRPETDPGDAARLFSNLPLAFVANLSNGKVQAGIAELFIFAEGDSFCEAICTLALQYAKGLT